MMIFREAIAADRAAIVEIHNQNVRARHGGNDRGFLLTTISEAELLTKIDGGTRYFTAIDEGDRAVGFLALSQPQIPVEFLEEVLEDSAYQTPILSDRHFYIQTVATRIDRMGRGIGQFIYRSLYREFPHAFLTAFIVNKPTSNDRSIAFHQKQGFRQIGCLRRDRFLDWENYESVLMFKAVEG